MGENGGVSASTKTPLAHLLRPERVEEFVGQRHLLGEGKPLRRLAQGVNLHSFVIWGPPGCGKTSFIHLAAAGYEGPVVRTSGSELQVREIHRLAAGASKGLFEAPAILCVEEVHRLSRTQQDPLLPYVEEGKLYLFATTTENPFFALRGSLLSRLQLYTFEPLSQEELVRILERACEKLSRKRTVRAPAEVLARLAQVAGGDARAALNHLEQLLTWKGYPEERVVLTPEDLGGEHLPSLRYDREGDFHYDMASAFIKSLRGSDPNAAVYWLARMLASGEDPRFLSRRMLILASEDIGNADPQALLIAQAAAWALERVGMPEAELILAHCCIYLACAPKSNACYMALQRAKKAVETLPQAEVPLHLKDASYHGASILGHQKGYRYPHEAPENFVPQDYLPKELHEALFYHPTAHGKEAQIRKTLARLWEKYRGRGEGEGT